ncbi:hypothetical protein D9619_005302 [Psilocybe cf. subviscida]|uniref:LIM zinc-binding domain-containing protein n=1 Tax=Psilocybe cf. subviscida TaxID=2480587 RepID=A0A8H5BWG5_9AGAR|nr:hypothetical protein D9619_005302 [Psilocybe cf. subviscida]
MLATHSEAVEKDFGSWLFFLVSLSQMSDYTVIVDDLSDQILYGGSWEAAEHKDHAYQGRRHKPALPNANFTFSFFGGREVIIRGSFEGDNNVSDRTTYPTFQVGSEQLKCFPNPPPNKGQFLCSTSSISSTITSRTLTMVLEPNTSAQGLHIDYIRHGSSSQAAQARNTTVQYVRSPGHNTQGLLFDGSWKDLHSLGDANDIKSAMQTSTPSSRVTYHFLGDSFAWWSCCMPPGTTGNAASGTYSIDGGEVTTFQIDEDFIQGPKCKDERILFQTKDNDLQAGNHTLEVVYNGDNSKIPLTICALAAVPLDYTALDFTVSNSSARPAGMPRDKDHGSPSSVGIIAGVIAGIIFAFLSVFIVVYILRRKRARDVESRISFNAPRLAIRRVVPSVNLADHDPSTRRTSIDKESILEAPPPFYRSSMAKSRFSWRSLSFRAQPHQQTAYVGSDYGNSVASFNPRDSTQSYYHSDYLQPEPPRRSESYLPMDELGDHTCTAPPVPAPANPPKPTNTSLLPARLQGRVASPGPSNAAPRAQESSQGGQSSSSTTSRLRINTRGSSGGSSPTQSSFQPRSSPLARRDPETASIESNENEIPFPSNPNPRMRTPSNTSEPRGSPFPPGSMARMRTPSNASSNPVPRMRTPSNASAGVSVPMPRTRTPSNAGPMPTNPPPPLPPGNLPGLPAGPGRPMPPQQQRSASINSMNSVNALPPPGGRQIGAPIPPTGGFPPRPGLPAQPGQYYNTNAGNGGPRPMGAPPPQISDDRPPPGPQEFIPPQERGIDTKSGGAAGMAGVGRRGFAAAARAAMFAAPNGRPMGPSYMGAPPPGPPGQYPMRRPNAPQYLDINADARSASTPPLSPGSGYSSHSPSLPSPLSQLDFSSNFPNQPKNSLPPLQPETRTPSPSSQGAATPRPNAGVTSPRTARPLDLPIDSPATARPNVDNTIPKNDAYVRKDSTASSRSASRPRGAERRPASPVESVSEYGGLAYADSTDYEDEDRDQNIDDEDDDFNSRIGRRRSRSPPPSTAKPSSAAALALLERTHSKASSIASSRSQVQFGSVRTRSRSNDRAGLRIGGAASIRSGSSLSREGSVSSRYSDENEDRLDDLAARLGRSQSNMSKASALSSSSSNHLRARGIVPPNPPARSNPSISSMVSITAAQQRPVGSSVSGSIRSRLNVSIDDTKEQAANEAKEVSRDDESIFGSANGSKAQRSNTVQGLQSPEAAKKPVKLPARALTSPKVEGFRPLISESSSSVGAPVKKARQPRTCMKCKKAIENGRWVSVDNGGVLCEKCWKNMYLPKCRRCDLPIEKAAVSSSDGQLKGKYHKECFNCHTCHKPFPDKTFYVYDGKPFCAYHYHEANDSLCSAARCGQPIEGPCAVSHNGDRYHPEHMTCEHPGYPECRERLNEYWEVDGRMLCERHANNATGNDSEGEDGERWVQSSKAMKRVTRFIDLTGAGGVGAGATPSVGNRL